MATEKQLAANRANALKSTGPRTSEGKASSCMNSVTHGLRARPIVLPAEDPAEFQQLHDSLEAAWQPADAAERILVEQMVTAYWKLARMEKGEATMLRDKASEVWLPLLLQFTLIQGRLERSFSRAQRDLERLQQVRRSCEPRLHASKDAPAPQPGKPSPDKTPAAPPRALYIMRAGAAPAPVPAATPARAGLASLVTNGIPAPSHRFNGSKAAGQ